MASNQIIYCEVRKNNKQLTPGHWFFHTGQWALCAEAIKSTNGKWEVIIHFSPYGKSLPEKNTHPSLKAAIDFIATYFDTQVVRGALPKVDDL